MFLLGGEYNLLGQQFWNVGLGFNLKLINEYFQNDFMINGGFISAKDIVMVDAPPEADAKDDAPKQVMATGDLRTRFLFSLKDSFYFSYDWKWIGVRAGVFASLGVYGVSDSGKSFNMSFNPGGFAGVCLFPRSIVSAFIDLCPGYLVVFRLSGSDSDSLFKNEAGFSLPLAAGIRINLDKF